MKTKIATSLLVILVAVSMIVGSTVAYFNHSADATGNTFSSGTLKMLVNSSDDNLSAVWSAPNWAPGQEVEAKLEFSNPGSIDSHHIYFTFTGNGDADMLSHIIVTKVIERYNGITLPDASAACAAQVGNGDSVMTLAELMSTRWMAFDNMAANNAAGDDAIIAAGGQNDYSITFAFKFDENAGNELQGKTCGFSLNMDATQNSPTNGYICFHP